jgi:DNA-binding PadR family transcriptional regulator
MAVSRDVLALTVLALLREQPRHPYEIQRVIRQRHKEFAMSSPRALYRAVEQLARDGAIEPIETSREGKRPERTVYQITDVGRDELENWLTDILENPLPEYPVLTAALNLMSHVPVTAAVESLQGRIVSLESQLAGLDAALRSLREAIRLPRLFTIDIEYIRALRQAELAWVKALLDDIQSGRLSWNSENPWENQITSDEGDRL